MISQFKNADPSSIVFIPHLIPTIFQLHFLSNHSLQTNKQKVFDFPYKYTIAKSVIKNICVYKIIPCRLKERDGKIQLVDNMRKNIIRQNYSHLKVQTFRII